MESEIRIDSDVGVPFQDRIDLDFFYDGPGRGEFLVQLQEAVNGGAPLMVLSGGEGSGKTTLCRMIEQQNRDSLAVVFFATTVESFEDVVRNIAAALGLQLAEADEGRSMDGAVDRIVAHVSREGRGLLLIFDEAEDIYLATLERIRKMLDRVTAAETHMQILFSGRKTFLENCEQLAICDFRNNEGIHIDLPDLSEEQVALYLRSIAEKTLSPEKQRVFNDEVVRNIHGLAKGRPRRLNLLARESLGAHGNHTSLMTLLDSVSEDQDGGGTVRRPVRRVATRSSFLWWVAGAAVVVVVLLLLFQPVREVKLRDKAVSSSVSNTAVVPEAAVKSEQVERGGGEQQALPNSSQDPPPTPASKPVEAEVVAAGQGAEPLDSPVPTVSPGDTRDFAPGTVAEASAERVAAVLETPAAPPVAPVKEPAYGAKPDEKVVVLKQVPPIKMRPSTWMKDQGEGNKAVAKIEGPQPTATLTLDQLYQMRLQAGTTWMKADKKDKFTVQLMVLTAKNAEANFKKMLGQANYRQEAGKFYIFKKNGSPEVVWVFYGEYGSLDLARTAQGNLPPFLREHNPYAISVKGAIGKVLAK
jgi:type II secretory pathway predicted ATPase ExeA/septal ring-binding cell division protein DamX